MKGCIMTASDIAGFRESLGWSQSELARQLGVTPAAVNQWESGKRVPSKPIMILIQHLRNAASQGAKNFLASA